MNQNHEKKIPRIIEGNASFLCVFVVVYEVPAFVQSAAQMHSENIENQSRFLQQEELLIRRRSASRKLRRSFSLKLTAHPHRHGHSCSASLLRAPVTHSP